MDISLKLESRAINPAVVNLFQFENETTTLNFVLDSYIWGESDLRNYKAYVITSINGLIDYTELQTNYDETDDKLSLSWLVQDYTLSEKGAITYQIVFKENTMEGNVGEEEVNTAVWYSYKAVIINRESIDGDNHIVANYPTILKQHFDKINELAGLMEAGIIYIPYGETINPANRLAGRVYYQYTDAYNVTGRFEDHEGNILIDNQSLTAVELQPNVNLNDIRESGVYYTSLNTNAATMLNTPIKEAFYLEVISMDENLTKQVWTHFNTTVGDVYTRKYYRGTWGEWYKTATTKYVDGTFLPLKGGTMSGTIVMPELSANIKGKDNTGQITILGGTEWDKGSHIMLRGNDRENNGGEFSIVCADGTNYQSLVGNLKGKLTWRNKNIVRSVGGVEADESGNVEIDGMGCKAVNVLTTVEEDTIDKWCELGAGVYYFSQLGLVSEQPSQYGFLINFTTDYNDVFQIWKKQSGGKMYYRSANANNWGESWVEIATTADVNTKLKDFVRTVNGEEVDDNGNIEIIAYDDMSMNGTTLKFSKTNGTSSSVDLGNTFATDSEAVHKTGNETIAGTKTLSSAPILSSATASTVPVFDANKKIVSSAVTSTELGYLDGVTSNIQTQFSGTVKTSGNQTVAGTKTFSTSPKVPTVSASTNDTTAASCQWVNSRITSIMNNYDYVIETYRNGTNWYRIYKSGWIEQGGKSGSISSGGSVTVTFSKAFADTNYTITGMAVYNRNKLYRVAYSDKTATSIVIRNTDTDYATDGVDWVAYGMKKA